MGNTPAYSHADKRPAGAVPLSRSGLTAGRGGRGDNSFGSFLARWGAVPVGATNLFRLLRDGEAVMLFPGGASEVRATASAACMCTLLTQRCSTWLHARSELAGVIGHANH